MNFQQAILKSRSLKEERKEEFITIEGQTIKVENLSFVVAPTLEADFIYWMQQKKIGVSDNVIFPGGLNSITWGVHIIVTPNSTRYYRAWDFWPDETPPEISALQDEMNQI